MATVPGRIVKITALTGLALCMSGFAASTAFASGPHHRSAGSAAGTIHADGRLSATVPGTGVTGSSVTKLVGKIATGSGIGSAGAQVRGETDASGNFSVPFVTPGLHAVLSGTLSGTLTNSNGSHPNMVSVVISVHCDIKFPPLSVACAITERW
jgi:hypothetical protein